MEADKKIKIVAQQINQTTGKCRVYLFTYKRNNMLKRAVDSLLAQTFTDWVCEVHNDDPNDGFPQYYIHSLNDRRFIIYDHEKNIGPTRSFNIAYSGCEEKYASILEDDNWWEPTFLEEMIAVMDTNTDLDVSWSNMNIWEETVSNTWQNTGKTIWPTNNDELFTWPQPKQALGALHSNGAMIYRGNKAMQYQVPENSLFNAVELIRERSFKFPVFLNSKVLANFSITITSSQSADTFKWVGTQTMIFSSYVINSQNKEKQFKDLLAYYRDKYPSPIPVFFLAVIFYLKQWRLLFNLTPSDWVVTIRWCLANCLKINALKIYLKSQQQTWDFLKSRTPKISNN